MKSLMMLWIEIANESAIRCHTSATLDIKTVQCRVKHEGLSFLTISLPSFGNDFQKSLDQGYVDPYLFLGFKRRACLPVFLQGFMGHVFDRDSGRLLNEPSIDAIQSIRQITLMFGKIALPCTPRRTRKAMDAFIKCEHDVRRSDTSFNGALERDFRRISSLLYARAFTKVDRKVYYGELVPSHGPGSTADSLRGNGKFRQKTWTRRLEEILPSGEFLLPNFRYYRELEAVDIVEPGQEKPVKVTPVPKTLKTPRIIAIEPTCMQYAQQALLPEILGALAGTPKSRKTHWQDDFLHCALGFEDQTPNQRMAQEGSLTGSLATLDLSEASDRVSNQHVRALLVNHPHLHRAVDASRSRKAEVRGHGVIRLSKFASMGSALCFPFEAMTFLVICLLGIEDALNTPLNPKLIKKLRSQVRIYGDDIIVPVEYVDAVVQRLHTFGYVVNSGKSFWTGRFRESCGKEYYAGEDVSIVKVRRTLPATKQHVPDVISLVSLRNQLYFAGYWRTCKWLDEEVRRVLKYFPVVASTSPVLGRHSFLYNPNRNIERMDENLHRPLVKGYVVSSVSPSDKLDDIGALLKFFLKRGGLPSVDEKHLERAGRPYAVDIKLRKGAPSF